MPAFEVENRTPAPVSFQLSGDFGRLRRVFEARAGEGARIRRGRASKAPRDLILYELHIRDWTAQRIQQGEAPVDCIARSLDYFDNLGVNAIEFMPGPPSLLVSTVGVTIP